MKRKMRRSRLRVAYFVLHLSLLSQVVCPHVESRPAAGQSIKDKPQSNQAALSTTDSSSSIPEIGDAWRNAYPIVEPTESSSHHQRSTQNPSSQEKRDTFPCSLNGSVLAAMRDEDKSVWLVDDTTLSALDEDIQSVINCTSANDTILVKTQRTLRPLTTLTIPWNLTLSGSVEGDIIRNGSIAEAKLKVMFMCPMKGPLIEARTPSFAMANMMITGCNSASDIVLLKPDCAKVQSLGQAQIVHTTFANNVLLNSGGLINGSRATYTKLSLEDMEFNQNSCDGKGCVLLSSNSTLVNIRAMENRKTIASSDDCSVFIARETSQTHVKNMSVVQNKIRIWHIHKSTLTISESYFEGNMREQSSMSAQGEIRGGVVFANQALLSIQSSIFKSNYGTTGETVYATFSDINIRNCTFHQNYATKDYGGAIFMEYNSSLDILQSTLDENEAEDNGGAIFINETSIFNLTFTSFTGNTAKEGGALYAISASSRLRDCKFSKNDASCGGACVFKDYSLAYFERVMFFENRAYLESGGAIDMSSKSMLHASHVTITGNEAKENCGGIYVHNGSLLNASKLQVISNSASNLDGGVGIFSNSSFLCYSCVFENNTSIDGAGLYIRSTSKMRTIDVQFQDCQFAHNFAHLSGGVPNLYS